MPTVSKVHSLAYVQGRYYGDGLERKESKYHAALDISLDKYESTFIFLESSACVSRPHPLDISKAVLALEFLQGHGPSPCKNSLVEMSKGDG